jgi:hypothetical protein
VLYSVKEETRKTGVIVGNFWRLADKNAKAVDKI